MKNSHPWEREPDIKDARRHLFSKDESRREFVWLLSTSNFPIDRETIKGHFWLLITYVLHKLKSYSTVESTETHWFGIVHMKDNRLLINETCEFDILYIYSVLNGLGIWIYTYLEEHLLISQTVLLWHRRSTFNRPFSKHD